MEGIGFKELYQVSLKTTYPIEIGNRKIETGETIAIFDKIQIANFQEIKKTFTTDRSVSHAIVWWEDTREVQISFVQGIFSKTQMALLTNAKLLQNEPNSIVNIGCREIVETDDKGRATTKHLIVPPFYVYDSLTGERIQEANFSGKTVFIGQAYKDIIIDYYYEYSNHFENLVIGTPLTTGYLSLEGKTRVKDDITGQVKTGIIRIPKLKLLSNLSMRLGNDAIPQVGRLDAVAVPTGSRGQKKVMELIFLNDDIDSDM